MSYIGPGDVITSGWIAFYSLRAFSSSYISGGPAKAVTVRRLSDNTTQDINVLTNGNLDTASALSFAGTDVTGTGTISGTSLTLTGGHVGDTITGTGVSPGTVITAGSSPSWTVNISQSVSSTTLTATWALFLTQYYDQSGNGNNVTQSNTTYQPVLVCAGGPSNLPYIFPLDLSIDYALQGGSGTYTQPWSITTVAMFYDSTNAAWSGGISGQWAWGNYPNNTSADVTLYAGNIVSVTGVSNAFHSVQMVADGATSTINVDGTASTGLNAGTQSLTSPYGIGSLYGPGSGDTCPSTEVGLLSIGLSSTQQTNLYNNQNLYWLTPGTQTTLTGVNGTGVVGSTTPQVSSVSTGIHGTSGIGSMSSQTYPNFIGTYGTGALGTVISSIGAFEYLLVNLYNNITNPDTTLNDPLTTVIAASFSVGAIPAYLTQVTVLLSN